MNLLQCAALWAAATVAVESMAGVDAALSAAIKDLAARVKVTPDEIVVESRSAVTWPDSSAGCPAPGMSYAQVLTEGSKLILAVEGKRYHYHSRSGKAYFYCADPSPVEAHDL